MVSEPDEIAALLNDWNGGRREALDQLMPLVYDQLRALANHHLRNEASGHTLRATELVHEAYMKLSAAGAEVGDPAHFYALASRIIRHMLINHGKAKRTQKRGHGVAKEPLREGLLSVEQAQVGFLEIDQALERLAHLDERKARLVELTVFGGMEQEQAGKALGLSPATVRRDLRLAKAFLYQQLLSERPRRASDEE